MKTRILKLAALCGLFVLGSISKYNAQSFSESFNDITLLAGNGWVMTNASVAVGSTNWFQGNPVGAGGPFDAYNGATNAYIGANYNNTGSTGTISNWLMTPNRTFRNGDVITFYTRKPSPDTYADRLEVRLSTNGASTNVGSGSAVGDYTTLLMSVNPSLVLGVYPTTWTIYTITISGLPAPTSGRIGFRYFVTGAGLSGTNSDYIGIDQVDYTPYVCPTFTMTTGGALTGGAAGSAYSMTLTQTGALGAPNFAVTAGALPPGLTLSAGGTISGTPTATGTFNFTATVSDASGCTGSQSYSITVVCPANPITLTTPPALCDNAGTYTLVEGSPAGGTYSGTGVTGSDFDPSTGTQTITYDYTDPYGCAFNANYAITVNPAPSVSLAPISAVCDNSGTLALTGESPAGGTFSGTGVTGTDFDPMAGSQTVTYSYTDANGCTNDATQSITVNVAPTVTQGSVSAVCSNAAPVALTGGSPVGGTYSGTGVNASGDFDPSAGTQTVTYTYTDTNNCSNAATTSITVNPAPTVSFTSPVSTMCVNHAPLTLSGGSPAGGTYSGAGVSGGVLNPATAGAGDHVITYSFTDANGCDGEAMFTIHVDACLGLTENSLEFALEIYPNPTTGMFTAKVTSGADFSIVNVVDIQGKAIQFGSSSSSAQTVDVDFSNQAPGMYFVTGLVDGQQITFRVQKH
ncbi:choice-of-anchor J domain-containing protein [Fluviicola sp.]|uniref:choice-of-anchor J domain-containing protein n=1 Tax=Fluviicola sp. TaxID=1917219 RepID=UPI003D2CB061